MPYLTVYVGESSKSLLIREDRLIEVGTILYEYIDNNKDKLLPIRKNELQEIVDFLYKEFNIKKNRNHDNSKI